MNVLTTGQHRGGSWNFVELPVISDPRGKLTFLEANRHVDFDIKRIYYLFDIPADAERGGHAHKLLQQLVIPLTGSFDILCDNGTSKEIITLNRPFRGLLIKNLVWRELLNFTSGAVCLVIASEPYDESDYFRNYPDFQAYVADLNFD